MQNYGIYSISRTMSSLSFRNYGCKSKQILIVGPLINPRPRLIKSITSGSDTVT